MSQIKLKFTYLFTMILNLVTSISALLGLRFFLVLRKYEVYLVAVCGPCCVFASIIEFGM